MWLFRPSGQGLIQGLPQGSREGAFWGTGLNQLISASWGDCLAYKTPSIYCLALYGERLPTALE